MTNDVRRRRLQLVMAMMRERRTEADTRPERVVGEPRRERIWVRGALDPDFSHATRRRIHDALTDARLVDAFEQAFGHRDANYDEAVRALGYVWECARDGTVNVTGFCCATCSARHAEVSA